MSKAPFEEHLVSMVSSLIHLRSIGDALRKKSFAIPRMRNAMASSLRAFAGLTGAFEETEAALQVDAQPYLGQWLASLGLHVGADVRFEGSNVRGSARVRGRLAEVRLHSMLVDAQRCVDLVLLEPSFAVGGGPYKPYDSFSVTELSPLLDSRRGFCLPVKDAAGVPGQEVLLTVPIRREDFDALMRSAFGIRIV